MKKMILVFCLFLLATVYVNAQTSQGNMMVGGSLSFTSNSWQGTTTKQLQFTWEFRHCRPTLDYATTSATKNNN